MPAQPASQPWVGRLARNTVVLKTGRTASNTTPTAIPKTKPGARSKASGAIILKFLRSFFQEATRRRPLVKKSKLFKERI